MVIREIKETNEAPHYTGLYQEQCSVCGQEIFSMVIADGKILEHDRGAGHKLWNIMSLCSECHQGMDSFLKDSYIN